MDSQYIPKEILDNPNIDMSDTDRIKELNDLFCEIHETDSSIVNTKDYKTLIKEINGRYDAEMLVKNNKAVHKIVKNELRLAKEELQNLKDNINQ